MTGTAEREPEIRPIRVPRRLDASAARLLTPGGVVVGGGFLVGTRQVMTCAHVVSSLLGLAEDEIPGQDRFVTLDFPLAAPGVEQSGVVEAWQPIRSDGTGDVAVLTLASDLPAGLTPIGLVECQDLWGHPFRAFGFPRGYNQGVWAAGVLRARQGTGWVQMETPGPGGYAVEPGFSGAAVWDDDLDGVVGMAVAADARRDLRAAYLIPTDTLTAAWPVLAERATPPSPYRGLAPFRERDAAVFLGRADLTELLIRQARHRALIAVVGPSGSGKSSVVFAGLLPRLVQQSWLTVTVRPSQGTSPLAALAAGLLPVLEPEQSETERLSALGRLTKTLAEGRLPEVANRVLAVAGPSRLLVVVDQFEELFGAVQTEAHKFIEAIFAQHYAYAGRARPLTLVLTLRADFLGQALQHPTLATALEGSITAIGQMSREQLRDVIEKPLPEGVVYESGLVERILDDVGTDAGTLPLLQFALTLLWEQQDHGRLTHRAYEQIGGVDGALVSYAESVYRDQLQPAEQDAARRLLVQLVRPSEFGEPVRRVARRPELDEASWQLGQRLAATRLLVADRDPTGVESVELVHEALIGRWSRLSQWVQEDYAFRSWQEGLRRDAAEWERLSKDPGALLRGASLSEAERWAAERPDEVSGRESTFIAASKALRDRSVRRLRTTVAVLSMLLVLAVTSGIVAVSFYRGDIAERRHDTLLERARNLADTQPEAAMLLAAAVYNLDDTTEAREILTWLADERRHFDGLLRPEVGGVRDLSFHPTDPGVVAVGGASGVRILEMNDDVSLAHLEEMNVLDLAFSPDGATLALAHTLADTAAVTLWSPANNEKRILTQSTPETSISTLSFSPDAQYVAGCSGHAISFTPVTIGQPEPPPAPLTASEEHYGCSFGFLDLETAIYLDGLDVVVWNISGGNSISRFPLTAEDSDAGLAVSADGRQVLVSDDNGIRFWDRKSGAPAPGPPLLPTHIGFSVIDARFTADGRQVLLGSDFGDSAWLLDLARGKPLAKVDLHIEPFEVLSFGSNSSSYDIGPDGTVILSADGGLIGVTDVAALKPSPYTGWIASMAFHSDDMHLSVISHEGTVSLLDLENGKATEIAPPAVDSATAADPDPLGVAQGLSGNGETAAVAAPSEGAIRVSRLGEGGQAPVVLRASGPVSAVAVDETGEYVGALTDRELELWKVSQQDKLWSAPFSTGDFPILAVGPGGRQVAAIRSISGDISGEAHFWETSERSDGEILVADATALDFSPTGRLAVGGTNDVTLWDAEEEPTKLGRIPAGSWQVTFGGGDAIALESSHVPGTQIWDVSGDNAEEPVFVSRLGSHSPSTFLPDGRQLFAEASWAFHTPDPGWALNHICGLLRRNLAGSEWEQYTDDANPERSC